MRYLWRAKLARVIDGDTVDMIIDTGFRTTRQERLRLSGVNAPEIEKDTKEEGLMSKHFVEGWFETDINEEFPFIVETFKSDSFGRYIARIWHTNDFHFGKINSDLSEALLFANLAVPYDKRG